MPNEDDNEIPVQTGDDDFIEGDDIEMAEEIEELRDKLDTLDPKNVAAIGCAVHFKQDETRGGESASGLTWRVLDSSLDGFESTSEVYGAIISFNEALEKIKMPTSTSAAAATAGPAELFDFMEDMFGGE